MPLLYTLLQMQKIGQKKSYPLKFELNLGSSTSEKNLVMKA